MVGESEQNWQEIVRRTIELAPDSVTIYQMEVPYNTTLSKEMRVHGEQVNPAQASFLYRNRLWAAADMLGLGVASFSHANGTQYQNEHDYDTYIRRCNAGELPLCCAPTPTSLERFVREFILQLKLGAVTNQCFVDKYALNPSHHFPVEFAALQAEGFLRHDDASVRLTSEGLLQVDRLLHRFLLPGHPNARYS